MSDEDAPDPSEDAAKAVKNLLSSVFPGLFSHIKLEPAPSTEKARSGALDKGKGKARAVDVEEPQRPAPESESADDASASILRNVMELSKSIPAPRSLSEAHPFTFGSPWSSSALVGLTVSGNEQVQINRAIALSSVEHTQNTLTKLQTDLALPINLDYYPLSIDDRDETASVTSASSCDLAKLIPYTRANKPVYKCEGEFNNLSEDLQLD